MAFRVGIVCFCLMGCAAGCDDAAPVAASPTTRPVVVHSRATPAMNAAPHGPHRDDASGRNFAQIIRELPSVVGGNLQEEGANVLLAKLEGGETFGPFVLGAHVIRQDAVRTLYVTVLQSDGEPQRLKLRDSRGDTIESIELDPSLHGYTQYANRVTLWKLAVPIEWVGETWEAPATWSVRGQAVRAAYATDWSSVVVEDQAGRSSVERAIRR